MSVTGIDFGTRSIVVAMAQRGGIDVCDNEASNRQTPSMVSFTPKGRLIGESASGNVVRALRQTALDVKRLLGRTASRDTSLAKDLSRLYTQMGTAADGSPTYKVSLGNEDREFRPEQVAAMLLSATAAFAKGASRDVVIGIPCYWTDVQRRAMLDAAAIAGLNPLRLLQEHAAVALAYGIYKTDLPEKDPRRVMIVDMGHASTWASVVAFVKGRLQVLSVAWDSNLGGRDVDEAVAMALLPEIQKRCKGDPRESPRAWYRLLAAIEKQIKRVISAGTPKAHMTVESLVNDVDFSVNMTREEFLAIAAPVLARLADPVRRALADSGVSSADLHSVEVHGGGLRLFAAQEVVAQAAGKEGVSKTINMEEGIARGCALMAAALSPSFRLREFKVDDVAPYAIRLCWKTIGDGAMEDEEGATIITRHGPIPAPKAVSFQRANPVEFTARYEAPDAVPGCPGPDAAVIGRYAIDVIPPSQSGQMPKIKVKARMSADGVFTVEEAETNEVIEELVEVDDVAPAAPAAPAAAPAAPAAAAPAAATPPPAEASPAPAAAATPEKPEEMQQSPKVEDAAPAKAEEAPAAKKKKTELKKHTLRKDLSLRVRPEGGLLREEVARLAQEEARLVAADHLAVETSQAKYSLESYEYTMREKMGGDLRKFFTDDEAKKLAAALDTERRWIEDESEDQKKQVYLDRLKALQAFGDAGMRRKVEYDVRPASIRELESAMRSYTEFVASADEKYAHIDIAERKKVADGVRAAQEWLAAQVARQEATPLSVDPVLTAAQISARTAELRALCNPVVNKPKPPPPKPAEPEKKAEEPAKPADDKPTPPPDKPAEAAAPKQEEPQKPKTPPADMDSSN